MLLEEVVPSWNLNRKAIGVLLSALFTALWSFFCPWVPCFTGEGDVMVNELAPYNEQHRYRVVMEPLILQQHSHEVQK